MTATPTAPGVYINEISSGVRSIAGVSTSTAAFVGAALRGPINVPWQIFNWGDYNSVFGGLSPKSEMSYAVWQFFQNQGSTAWIVRVGNDAQTAISHDSASNPWLDDTLGNPSLTFSAFDGGLAGNGVSVSIYAASDPNRFNAIITGVPDATGNVKTETYNGLSMNSRDGAYVQTVINNQSSLVTVQRAPLTGTGAIVFGSGSSTNTPPPGGYSGAGAQMTVVVDGSTTVPIVVAGAISQIDLVNALSVAALTAVATVVKDGPLAVKITSKSTGESSSVVVLPGSPNDAARLAGFGVANGGIEVDGTAQTCPLPSPNPGNLVFHPASTELTVPTTAGNIALALDGGRAVTIALPASATLDALATNLQAAVQTARPGVAYTAFTAVHDPVGNTLKLSSGTRASGSGVAITNASTDTTAATIGLTGGAPTLGSAQILTGGSELPFDPTNPYSTIFPASNPKGGLYALEDVQIFNLLVLAGISDGATLQDAATYCVERSAFLIMDPPPGLQPAAIETYATGPLPPKSDHAALYYPYIDITDPLTGATRPTPPSGTMAGVYAATDATRGVWKAPAGTNANLAGAIGVEYNVTTSESGVLNPIAINAIRNLVPYGIVSWGARTMHGQDANPSDYKYVPVRRLALYIEQSLYQGTQWVVFEPNDEQLWAALRLSIGSFMDSLFRQGAFAGTSPRSAYFVKCDAETNPVSSTSLGVLNAIVGFAPVYPAEFVIITIQQMAGQSST
jgi:phage tail sheath protein FI